MKRLLSYSLIVVMVLFSVVSIASAESIDLSGMSIEELVALKDRINLAIWNSAEWQEVTVPQGLWKVGVDIPAGTWTIRCEGLPDNHSCQFTYGEKGENDVKPQYNVRGGRYDCWTIYNPNYDSYKEGKTTEVTITLIDGDYVYIENSKAVFTPYVGASFSFK